MTFDPRIETPESSVDSGASTPSGAESATRSAPTEAVESADAESIESSADAELPEPIVDGEAAEFADGELPEPDIKALAEKAEKADEYLELAQRTRAEFENYRKRTTRETAAAQERGAIKLALALLPAVDNLERALAHAPADEGDNGADSFVSGIKHVHSDVVGALKGAGIEWYSPEGEAFDPQYHEAVAQQPVEGAEPGTVVEVFQRGYRLGENVLRPARVVVAG